MSTTNPRRRILVFTLTPPLPVTSGGPAYVMNTISQLAGRHDFHLFAFGTDADREKVGEHRALYRQFFKTTHVEPRPALPAEKPFLGKVSHLLEHVWHGLPFMDLSYFSRSALRRARAIIRENAIDAMEIHTAHLAYFKHFFPEIPALLVGHNIESDLFPFWIADSRPSFHRHVLSRIASMSRRNARRVELENAWGFEAMTFISHEDMARATACGCREYLPLCFPIRDDDYDLRPREFCDMLWMGGFGWYPNAEAVIWFVREIFPLIRPHMVGARIRLHFLGGSPPKELVELHDGKQVIVHGFLPSIDSLLGTVHLLMVPLLSGGGVRVKILEAMSHGIPVLSTSKGCEGLGAHDGEDIVIRDRPEDFAAAMLALAADHERRKTLAKNARELLRRQYDLTRCVELKDKIYATIGAAQVRA